MNLLKPSDRSMNQVPVRSNGGAGRGLRKLSGASTPRNSGCLGTMRSSPSALSGCERSSCAQPGAGDKPRAIAESAPVSNRDPNFIDPILKLEVELQGEPDLARPPAHHGQRAARRSGEAGPRGRIPEP